MDKVYIEEEFSYSEYIRQQSFSGGSKSPTELLHHAYLRCDHFGVIEPI
ncbi:hypothetical protein [Nostoc sp. DedQUE09]|nr:hypothetical protein [Nostoc sp. DedQUE09]